MEHFFMRQDYYTLIFDNQKQMKLMKDTTIDHVVVEKVFYSRPRPFSSSSLIASMVSG